MNSDSAKLDGTERRVIIGRLLRDARPYRLRLALSLILGVVGGAGPLALTKAFQLVVDDVILNPKHPITVLVFIMVAVFGINLISNVATYGQSYLTAWSGQHLIASFRLRLFERTLRMPLSEFDRWRPGDLIARFINDLALMTDALSVSLPQFFQALVTLIGAIVYLVYLDWQLASVLFILAPIMSFVVSRFTKLISSSTKRAQERFADLSSNLSEILAGERVVKAFGRESHEVGRFASSNENYFGAYMKSLQLAQTQTPIVAMIITVGLLAIVAFSVHEALVGRLSGGQVVQFYGLVITAMNPLNRLAAFVGDISRGLVGAKRIYEVLDLPVEPSEEEEPLKSDLVDVRGEIGFENVTFAYAPGAPPVLLDVGIRVAAGEIIALVGPSGAGKTTLVNLVPRFYTPQRGRITLDGHDLEAVKLASLRSSIAIVPQEAMLFSGSIADNIRYGKLDATQAELEHAAREANAEEFILDLPHGYETLVGDRGMRLSGGQRQRISIARAVLRDPRILILDEATSALDSHSERLIEAALDQFLPGRTTLIIAHRLSTIRRANRIFYLEGGRVLETGTHDDLLSRGGLYAALYAAQFA